MWLYIDRCTSDVVEVLAGQCSVMNIVKLN